MIRFSKNGYNVPFGRKPNRFRPALITKIVNQVENVQSLILNNNWKFLCSDWESLVSKATADDFIYLDPPYIGRNTDYFTSWEDEDAQKLADYFNARPTLNYALSMWYENKYRKNDYISAWNGHIVTNEHYYFVGGHEKNRNSIIEALIVNC